MFFEDVDLGWRLWLLGYRVRYVPDSIVYHRHHAIDGAVRGLARAVPARAQRALHDLQELRRRQPRSECCPPRCSLAIRRGIALGGVDPRTPRPRQRATAHEGKLLTISRQTVAPDVRHRRVRRRAAVARETRRELQAARRRPDHEITPLVRAAAAPQHRRSSLPRRVRERESRVPARGRGSAAAAGSSSRPATCSSRRWPARRSGRGRSPWCCRASTRCSSRPQPVHTGPPRLPGAPGRRPDVHRARGVVRRHRLPGLHDARSTRCCATRRRS